MKSSQSLILSEFVANLRSLRLGRQERGYKGKEPYLSGSFNSILTGRTPASPPEHQQPSLRAADAALPGTGRLSHTPAGRWPLGL